MQRRPVGYLLLLFLVGVPAKAQPPAEIDCTSAAVGFYNGKPNGIIHMPQSVPILLTVNVPKGGTPTSLEMSAIGEKDLGKGKAWVQCQSGKQCGGLVTFSEGLSVAQHGASEIDGGARYEATIWATGPVRVPLPGEPPPSPTIYVKLAVTYKIASRRCVSEASKYITQGQTIPVTLVVPPGKHVVAFDFYGLESPHTTADWVPCDSWTQSGGFTLQTGCDKAGRPIGGLTYYLTWIKETGLKEDNQKLARGLEALCTNKSGTSRYIKVTAYYVP